MAELNVFLTKAEYAGTLVRCLANGFSVIEDGKLPTPVAAYCRTAADVDAAVSRNSLSFFLERSDFSIHPLRMREVERENVTFWYLRAVEGGPVIELHYWNAYERDRRRVIPGALFAYHSKIINPDTGVREPSGPAVKAAFVELTRPLRKGARRVRSVEGTRTALVTPGVDAMLAEGWELGPPFSAPLIESRASGSGL